MKKSLLLPFSILLVLVAYFMRTNSSVEAQPVAKESQASESSVNNEVAASAKADTAPVVKKDGEKKKKVAYRGLNKKKKKPTVAKQENAPAKVATTQMLPKMDPNSLLPRGLSDSDITPVQLKVELGETVAEIEARRTMKIRTHQEVQQYRMVALAVNF